MPLRFLSIRELIAALKGQGEMNKSWTVFRFGYDATKPFNEQQSNAVLRLEASGFATAKAAERFIQDDMKRKSGSYVVLAVFEK